MDFNDAKNLQLTSEDGTVINFSNNTTIEITDEPELIFDNCGTIVGFHERERKAIITVRPDENGVLFSMTTKEKENEMETKCSVVWCRFARANGEFDINSGKLYRYLVDAPLEKCEIQVGTIFKVLSPFGSEEYSGTKLRCEAIEGYSDKVNVELVYGKLKEIKSIKLYSTYPYTEPLKFISKTIDGQLKPLYYDGKTPEEFFNDKFIEKCHQYPQGRVTDAASRVSVYKRNTYNKVATYVKRNARYPDEIALSNETALSNEIALSNDSPLLYVSSAVDSKCWVDNTKAINTTEANTGGNDMNTNMFGNVMRNMKFGKVDTKDIKYSFKGIAFRTADNDYVCYNSDFTFTNVGNMIIDMPIFAIPVCRDKIEVGDVILHNDQWVIVNDISESEIKVAKPWNKEVAYVIPETSIFGFSYYTKVLNMFESFGNAADSDNPFGNMLPFMLMSQGGDTKNDMTTMMMLMAMNGGEMNFDNPLMMMMLMGGDTKIDPMMMMFMMNGEMFGKKCNCRGKRAELQPVKELTQEEIAKLMAELENSFTSAIENNFTSAPPCDETN